MDALVADTSSGAWKRQKLKLTKYEAEKIGRCKDKDPSMKTFKRPCQNDNKQFSSKRVTMFDMVKARSQLSQTPNKAVQDQRLCHFMSVGEPTRKCPRTGTPTEKAKPRSIHVTYFMRTVKGPVVPKLRANSFYDLAKQSPPSSYSTCFDLQQVQPLPWTPIPEAFYSRQMGFYSLYCVPMDSKTPKFYVLIEDQAGMGSTEVSSALLHCLSHNLPDNISSIHLFCDGCGVRGHSFLPADRVFGRMEKLLRKLPLITTKREYETIYSQVGNVHALVKDWKLHDVKALSKVFNNVHGISDSKRIFIEKYETKRSSAVMHDRAMTHYSFDRDTEPAMPILKRGIIIPDVIP
ncbi:hypothetical protein PR048_029897 [Dryococelus australis]|uniref:Uncharacterized protein n=1 Tax=Dryococelus australis TaxID=614101 RepID=A0ABQ9GBD4_9NEOP|nr:hypothetical protein PR048_029897 [Dryococelus australis]